MTYTSVAVVAVVATVLFDGAVLRTNLLRRKLFWASYAVVVGFQLVVNGVLTCRSVVRYDEAAITGIRVACAPVEDLLFGFAMITQVLAWWVWLGRRGVDAAPPGERVSVLGATRRGAGARR